jgi:hypothetical protein
MGKEIDPNKMHVGDVVLVATGNKVTIGVQEKLGYKERSKWTHVAGSLGGHDLIEGQVPRSRVCDLQKDYVRKDFEITVLRPAYEHDGERIKVALWWATMNNLPYDLLQLSWFPMAGWLGRPLLAARNLFNSTKRLICSELIANGFYKQGYNLFNRPASNILPADFDGHPLLSPVADVWM